MSKTDSKQVLIENRFDYRFIRIGPDPGGGSSYQKWRSEDKLQSLSIGSDRILYTNQFFKWDLQITDPVLMTKINNKESDKYWIVAHRCLKVLFNNVEFQDLVDLICFSVTSAKNNGIAEGRKQKIDEFMKFIEK